MKRAREREKLVKYVNEVGKCRENGKKKRDRKKTGTHKEIFLN